jgi:HK97 family phage portal protein
MGLIKWFTKPFRRKMTPSASKVSISSGYDEASWTPNDYDNFAKETYLKNVIAYRCIDELSTAIASVPWGVYTEKKSGKIEQVKEDDMSELIKRPNPEESWPFWMLKLSAFLIMSGSTFPWKIKPMTGPNQEIPQELWILRPDRMKILKQDGFLNGYEYTVNDRVQTWYLDPITKKCDVLQIKTFNPIDDWWGASVTEPIAREIDTSNEMTEWNKKLLENEGRPGMIITVNGELSDPAFDRLEKQLKAKAGSIGAGENLILEGPEGIDVKPYGWSPMDLDFIEGGRELARRICNGYQVPPQLIGIPGDNKYANYQEARYHFYEGPVDWYLNFFKGELNNWLYERGATTFLSYDMNDVPALAPKRDKLWERASKATFLTENEKRKMVGYDPVGPEGDVIMQQANLIPLGTSPQMIEENKTEEEKAAWIHLLKLGYKINEIHNLLAAISPDEALRIEAAVIEEEENEL